MSREQLDSLPLVDEDQGDGGYFDALNTPCASVGCHRTTLGEHDTHCVDCQDALDRARALVLVPSVLAELEVDADRSLAMAMARAERIACADHALSTALFWLIREWNLAGSDRAPVAAPVLRARLAAEARAT